MPDESFAFPQGTDSYSIDLVLRHPSLDVSSTSATLSLETFRSWRGDGPSTFHGRLQAGDLTSDFSVALANVSAWLDAHAAYFTEFVKAGGEAELVLNHVISRMDEPGDKCFELRLEAEFLQQLSSKRGRTQNTRLAMLIAEIRRSHSNFDFFRFSSHLKRLNGRKMSVMAIFRQQRPLFDYQERGRTGVRQRPGFAAASVPLSRMTSVIAWITSSG